MWSGWTTSWATRSRHYGATSERWGSSWGARTSRPNSLEEIEPTTRPHAEAEEWGAKGKRASCECHGAQEDEGRLLADGGLRWMCSTDEAGKRQERLDRHWTHRLAVRTRSSQQRHPCRSSGQGEEAEPDLLTMSPRCGPWSQFQRLNHNVEHVMEMRQEDIPLWLSAALGRADQGRSLGTHRKSLAVRSTQDGLLARSTSAVPSQSSSMRLWPQGCDQWEAPSEIHGLWREWWSYARRPAARCRMCAFSGRTPSHWRLRDVWRQIPKAISAGSSLAWGALPPHPWFSRESVGEMWWEGSSRLGWWARAGQPPLHSSRGTLCDSWRWIAEAAWEGGLAWRSVWLRVLRWSLQTRTAQSSSSVGSSTCGAGSSIARAIETDVAD